mgnify:CR=1 FL=1
MDFRNKNIVITGGSTGIGLACAEAFIAAGAKVWITGRNSANLHLAASSINSINLKTLVSDTSNLAGIADLEKAIAESGIKIDVLLLNAGMGLFGPIATVTEADFDIQFNTNVKGSFFTLQQLMPHLANGSSVLFTSSTAASAAIVESSVYAATKAAINKIAAIAANELAPRKIRVNIISPGPIATAGFESTVASEAKAQLAAGIALQRMGKPEEIAKTVLFLSSDDAAFISGTELLVDGGFINYALK